MNNQFLKFNLLLFILLHASVLFCQNFSDQSTAVGLIATFGDEGGTFSGGMSFVDFNQDGWDDLTICTQTGDSILFFVNNQGVFQKINSLVPNNYFHKQALWIDIDNDGDLDFTHTSYDEKDKLYENIGNFVFDDITRSAHIHNDKLKSYAVCAADIDMDGLLDLFYDIRGPNPYHSLLYHNAGDNKFTDITIASGANTGTKSDNCATFLDFDNDGDPDLYSAVDKLKGNMLFRNEGNLIFTDVSHPSNTALELASMNTGVGDINNDGYLDIYVTDSPNRTGNVLLLNNGNGTFTDISQSAGVDFFSLCWGGSFADFNNDGYLDLYVCSQFTTPQDHNKLYINNQDLTFTEVNDTYIQNALSNSYTSVIGDYNNDGRLDIAVSNGEHENVMLIKNDLAIDSNYIKISLEGVVSNRDAIGVWLEAHAGGITQYRYTHAGIAYLGQDSKIVHFGFGDNTVLDSLIIKWPSGLINKQYNLPLNQTISILEDLGNIPITCFNNIKDADETGVDCGGPSCELCECNDEIKVISNDVIYNTDFTHRYNDYVEINSDAVVNPAAEIEFYAKNYIELKEGFIEPNGGNILLDIEACSSTDICENTTLCNNDHFDVNNLNSYSMARIWMEVLLESIRKDFARPTIHARNLYHSTAMMYDVWHAFNTANNPNGTHYMVNQNLNGFACPMNLAGLNLQPADVDQAISYAMARLLQHRFATSPSFFTTDLNIQGIFNFYGYDVNFTDTNYATGNPAAIGNHIAQCYINYGLKDGANEVNEYINRIYTPVNDPLVMGFSGNQTLSNPSRWQPLTLDVFIDQSGNQIPVNTPDFLSPEWGTVNPFAMNSSHVSVLNRDGSNWKVYYDPSDPPYFDLNNPAMTDEYKWGFLMVSVWGAHLDSNNPATIDISPGSVGNNTNTWPTNFYNLPSFYDFYNGGDYASGHATNPSTGQAYAPQVVKMGDYARVLAEFWADGPDSETPPGHWFTILNYVSDHPAFVKQFEGSGQVVDDLEWDIKSYFALGGAMHDAALAAWSIKGYYDYVRPVSAIRYMGQHGQSSDPNQPSYSSHGLPLEPGFCELVGFNDPLAGPNNENVFKVKLYTWKGPDYINDPENDEAGVGWILAENWWPYQRPSFVTPPFAGYVSGHSTFSRAAAEVMTSITGDAFFPGGMGEFTALQNEFLVFEDGPSQDIILQWATYRDASDQCSLSRIWGGIHPPADDIPGRIIGEQIGVDAFNFAKNLTGF